MDPNGFSAVAAAPDSPKWSDSIRREAPRPATDSDFRSDFARDYTRILHSSGYRRLKHKTQVFFNVGNDHVCTRIEHVAHVESVSGTIGAYLGLNTQLIRAIAVGHDIGHAPFGHQGETALNALSMEHLGKRFWHECNGLRFVDGLELLENSRAQNVNLNLTYAVRDGIVCHCGEELPGCIIPRQEAVELTGIRPGQYAPYTWEGCVVKISDIIAYMGRDIEDALRLGFIGREGRQELIDIAHLYDQQALNTTVIMNAFIRDLCANSSPEKGICLSPQAFEQMKRIVKFNYAAIYGNPRLTPFKTYADLLIREIFSLLLGCYDGPHTFQALRSAGVWYPKLISSFMGWVVKYMEPDALPAGCTLDVSRYPNRKVYGRMDSREMYIQAIIDYISGMTDRFAIESYQELITFRCADDPFGW